MIASFFAAMGSLRMTIEPAITLEMPYSLAKSLVFRIDPERSHNGTISALSWLPRATRCRTTSRVAVRVAGLAFPNPVGLAAGFDKDGRVPGQMFHYGFGFVEAGTLTPLPQTGNPRPRLFRLVPDRAVINRMGFNNGGQAAAHRRLAQWRDRPGPVGVNIGANRDSADRIADYAAGAAAMADVADYLAINISSPNTPGLRELQDRGALDALLGAVMAASRGAVPLFVKVAPDLGPRDIDDIVAVAIARGIAGLIVGNTTLSRPLLNSARRDEAGGLSGAPLAALAAQRLADFRRASGGRIVLIAAGGIATAADAYARIRAGASLVQLYSAMVYAGPGVAGRIATGLDALLAADGFANVADAIGVDA